jgi:hypothetical protein
MTNPRTVLPPLRIRSPEISGPANSPFSSTIGVPANPGWVVASIVTDSVIVGSAEVGRIVSGPAGMLKVIVSRPSKAGLLAVRMAWRSEPGPESLVLITVSEAAWGNENSEVLPAGSVAVAVTNLPTSGTVGRVAEKLASPDGVGGHGDLAEELLPLRRKREVGVGEELDGVRGVGRAGECPGDPRVGRGGGRRDQDGEILEVVRSRVGVTRVVRGETVVLQVDAQPAVGEDRVGEDGVARAGRHAPPRSSRTD